METKRTVQFDLDLQGEFADLFLAIREILLSFPDIREQKNAKQTAYYGPYSAVGFLRSNDEKLTFSLAKGVKLQEKYPSLQGHGKIVRHLYFGSKDELDETLLHAIIEETLILNLEAHEMKKLRKKA